MLEIIIPGVEKWDEAKNKFVYPESATKIRLEHSLISLAKWESKWHKPYMSNDKTDEEVIDYIRCMTLTKNVDSDVYYRLSVQNAEDIENYIHDSMTATRINNFNKSNGKSIVTAEIIYYAMIAYNIPFECQKWHLNRLLTLIEVCRIKNEPPKKMSQREIMERNKKLNEMRKASLNTTG